jgi:putative transposase
VAFIDDHKKEFGVVPICRVLCAHGCQIAPSTYYAAKTRPPSPRALADAELLAHIERIYFDPNLGRELYGARKMWRELPRQKIPAARCTVERLMRKAGLRGARRGRRFATTIPDKTAARPPDLVNRNFHAERPNALWVVDITYVPTWSGMAFTAFVCDVFSRRIVGWRTAASMPTSLPLDALEMAIWIRARAGQADPDGRLAGLVHHSDAGSQGEFKWSSQHLGCGGVGWADRGVGRQRRREGRRCGRPDGRGSINGRSSRHSGGGSRRATRARTRRRRAACRSRWGHGGFVTLAACHRSVWSLARDGTYRSPSVRRSRC